VVDVWICNSSPLISLARIDRLDLIEVLAPRIIVPATVVREIEAGSDRDNAAHAIKRSSRLQVKPDVELPESVRSLRLDPGESQVLAVAFQEPGCGVVLDDRAARRCAARLSIPMIGTIGIVALARQRGILKAAAPIYQALRAAGLFLSPAIMKAVLSQLGEELK
jgi:predicted nucleic acid-binding protein